MRGSASLAIESLPAGRDESDHAALARLVNRRVSIAMTLAHTLGAIDLFVLMFWVLPTPADIDPAANLEPNLIAMAVYLPLATIIGKVIGYRVGPASWHWLRDGRAPTEDERRRSLAIPLHCLRLNAGLWFGGMVLFTALNATIDPTLAKHVAFTILLGGLTTCAVAYLLVERLMRPVTAIVLAAGPQPKPVWPGVEGRIVLAWLAATGIPLIGLLAVGVDALTDPTITREEVGRAVLVLGVAAFATGLGVTLFVARALAAPLTAVRRALARVQAGDLGTEVHVDDASEIGTLQTGFNQMAAGLRERERIQDLYSRQVGEDVARLAAGSEGDPTLGGEIRDIAALFVDIVGSTSHAQTSSPHLVVARLNRFFAIVVDVVGHHGGWVNKFEGDAALCVFGAPAALGDPERCALAAARELDARLRDEMPSTEVGIGVSAGAAVAGWVGAERRFEYTVIGDPVNEAARLCELAKTRESRVLASEAIVSLAGRNEGALWRIGEQIKLRGRSTETRIAAPA